MSTDATSDDDHGEAASDGTVRGQAAATDGDEASVGVLPLPPKAGGLPFMSQTFGITRDPFEAYEHKLAPHGDRGRYWFAGRRWVTFHHPDHIQQALLDD